MCKKDKKSGLYPFEVLNQLVKRSMNLFLAFCPCTYNFSVAEQQKSGFCGSKLVNKPRKLLRLILGIFKLHGQCVQVQIHADTPRSNNILNLDLGLYGYFNVDLFQTLNYFLY